MKELILKFIEYRKHKFDRLNCAHDYKERERSSIKTRNLISGAESEDTLILYSCSKCGKFNKISMLDKIY